MIDFLQSKKAKRRFWILSDLQQSNPEYARKYMTCGLEDFLSLGLKVDAVCYLGDSTEGANLEHIREMAAMQMEALSRVDAPIYYALGNHEFDYHRATYTGHSGKLSLPMRELVATSSQWHIAPSASDWTFSADFGDMALFFFTDHGAPDGSWFTTHCYLQTPRPLPEGVNIPYSTSEEADKVRAAIANIDKPVFTLSHYAFPGGNRDFEGKIQAGVLPLPGNVVAHIYGHSHIGDRRCVGEFYLRQISTISDSPITQFDIASFEKSRGTAVRSAILEWYGASSYGIFYRNHSERVWEKVFAV